MKTCKKKGRERKIVSNKMLAILLYLLPLWVL